MRDMIREKPSLVQRMTRRSKIYEKKKGVDRFFAMDYMGSSEFEWGAMPKALKLMRAELNRLNEFFVEFEVNGIQRIAWIVCTKDELDVARRFVEDQVGDRMWSLQERTNMDRSYSEKPSTFDATGWWALDTKTPFAIFMEKRDARNWLEGLRDGEE